MAKRIGKPINRFDVQVVYPSGFYIRWQSRRDPPHTPTSIADSLEEYVKQIREAVKHSADRVAADGA